MIKKSSLYSVEERVTGRRWLLRVNNENSKNETMLIEVCKVENNEKNKHSIAYVWKRAGFIPCVYSEWWSITTEVKDKDGNCYGRYNPQHKVNEEKTRLVINFDWLFNGCTSENLEKLINEALRQFFAA